MDIGVGGFGNQIHDQRVGRGGSDEHGRGNRVAVVVYQGQVFADAALRAFFRVGIEAARNGFHNWVDDAAAARSITGRYRGKNQLGNGQAVADAQGFLAEQGDKVIADTRAQPGFQDAARNHDGNTDEPNQRVAEGAQRVFNGHGGRIFDRGAFGIKFGHGYFGNGHQHNGENRQCADGHGFADNGGNHAHKQRQQMPGIGGNALRHGNDKPNQQRQRHGHRHWYGLKPEFVVHFLLLNSS